MRIFHASRVVSVVINHVNLVYSLNSVIWIIEILCSLVEHVHIICILLKLLSLLVHFVAKLDILIETAPSRSSTRISRSLSLSFNTFDDFSGFWIDSTKWIHATIFLLVWM